MVRKKAIFYRSLQVFTMRQFRIIRAHEILLCTPPTCLPLFSTHHFGETTKAYDFRLSTDTHKSPSISTQDFICSRLNSKKQERQPLQYHSSAAVFSYLNRRSNTYKSGGPSAFKVQYHQVGGTSLPQVLLHPTSFGTKVPGPLWRRPPASITGVSATNTTHRAGG